MQERPPNGGAAALYVFRANRIKIEDNKFAARLFEDLPAAKCRA
jgi:hypothetical protein